MKKDWMIIPDEVLKMVWVCTDEECMGEVAIISPSFYQDNGTPICRDGHDMEYLYSMAIGFLEKPHNEETYNWMEALEMIEQGQPVCHPKLPSHVFMRGKNGQIMCQLRGKQYGLNNIAIKTIFQGLLHDGWHNHQ